MSGTIYGHRCHFLLVGCRLMLALPRGEEPDCRRTDTGSFAPSSGLHCTFAEKPSEPERFRQGKGTQPFDDFLLVRTRVTSQSFRAIHSLWDVRTLIFFSLKTLNSFSSIFSSRR